MPERDTDSPPKLDIDWLKTTAGALAAVTTAVLPVSYTHLTLPTNREV